MRYRLSFIVAAIALLVAAVAVTAVWRRNVASDAMPSTYLPAVLPPLENPIESDGSGEVLGISSEDHLTLVEYVADANRMQQEGLPLAAGITLPEEEEVLLDTPDFSIVESEPSHDIRAGQPVRRLDLINKATDTVLHREEMSADRVVVTAPDRSRQEVQDIVGQLDLTVTDEVSDGVFVVLDPQQRPLEQLLAQPELSPLQEAENSMQPDMVMRLLVTPNDPQFANQWALTTIHAPEAWDVASTSAEVTVAVLDTGLNATHPDLTANVWTNPDEIAGNSLDDDANGYVDDVSGYDFVNNDALPVDDHGHGTHVAGTIGATGNNAVGVAGITWQVKLMPLKFLDNTGSGWTTDAIRALDYAQAEGAHITSNSWGGTGFSQALYDALARTEAAGMLAVAAAGNEGSNSDTSPLYPAAYALDSIISVANSTEADALHSSSNYGVVSVDLAAPGTAILSTHLTNTYATMTGTSMATPHVAGALALLKSVHPTWTAAQLTSHLLGTVDVVAALDGKVKTSGRLNLAQVVSGTPTPTPSPTPTPTPVPASSSSDSGGGGSGGGGGGDGGGGGGGSSEPARSKPPGKVVIFQAEKAQKLGLTSDGGRKAVTLTPTQTLSQTVSATPGTYFLDLTVKHPKEGPIKVVVLVNNKAWKTVTLTKKDGRYHTVRVGSLRKFSKAKIGFKVSQGSTLLDWWRLVPAP